MKVFPAEYCLRRAIGDGLVNDRTLVIETSSGTMAYGLAVVCTLRHLSLTIVTDHGCDRLLLRKLRALNVDVEIVPAPAQVGGYQRARLDRLREICTQRPQSWWVNQYDNPGNAASYATVAAEIVDRFGQVDYLVGPVGSGGSMCGLSAHLRYLFPSLRAIAVDTFGSVLFGQPDAPRTLRGLGNSILPANLDHTVFDDVHWLSAGEAFAATRDLYRQTSLFVGPTSGASWLVAQWYARGCPEGRVLCVCPDSGERYIDTVYHDDQPLSGQLCPGELSACPTRVERPIDAHGHWSMLIWGHRSLEDVLSPNLVQE